MAVSLLGLIVFKKSWLVAEKNREDWRGCIAWQRDMLCSRGEYKKRLFNTWMSTVKS
ncbi:hypothetical protein [Bacillus thuringiensis]|uniref:hypothetical protein n=1 Tax=Bacillus cereus group TaxID=86661 RepID=UPI000A5E2B38|nr:hypothetical protein [Bacillus thuringiensis]MDA2113571.1 hypothetical protein [Bacillus cereus]MDA2153051.1 hypothetical protein [Bacillus cereus]MEB8550471.1 hypothetical protein [Bacillus cereus]MEB8728362.1 hypothetical protein [Bacillus cereus]MEB8896141.1 hypothetical protein [Bacillus cereus]